MSCSRARGTGQPTVPTPATTATGPRRRGGSGGWRGWAHGSHGSRHDLRFHAAGLTFYAATAVVPLLLVAWFAAALVPATGYGGQGAAGRLLALVFVAGGLEDLAAALG